MKLRFIYFPLMHVCTEQCSWRCECFAISSSRQSIQ
ncbi:unnamed protein product [Larinioides sclopetarius]|uniref:Uncharacterized protein n=1 Tax=Larinioides sclopetarius TaxID=280406 RepID=A0AAV2ARY6_9ARAC